MALTYTNSCVLAVHSLFCVLNYEYASPPVGETEAPAFYDLDQLGERWHCDRMTAYRRALRFGVRPFKPSERAVLFRASDIALVENNSI